jgi:hypothetical protein
VWRERPRGDFKNERYWRMWNTGNKGQMVGSIEARGPKLRIRDPKGRTVCVDLRGLAIAFGTGAWPRGKLPPWNPGAALGATRLSDSVGPSTNAAVQDVSDEGGRRRVQSGWVGEGVLAGYFADQCVKSGKTPDELTVLGGKNGRNADPFRLDTPSNRRFGDWYAEEFNRTYGAGSGHHLRGQHYVFSAGGRRMKPNGHFYLNDWTSWRWLTTKAAKFARWLGLVAWSRVPDARNENPVIYRPARAGEAEAKLLTALPVPDEIDVTPTPTLEGFRADQRYALAFFTEKSSVVSLLQEIGEPRGIDLCLSTGDMVDRRIWELAEAAHRDGRKLILFCVSDCDPAGYGMPRAIARKLQAHAVATFPGLEFEVVRAALTPSQARALDLPDAPLKSTELRAPKWRAAFGMGQIELDAALALRRDEFRAMIEAMVEPYFDDTLADRGDETESDWRERAEEVVRDSLLEREIAWLQARYDAARAEMEAVNARLAEIVADIELPPVPATPEPNMDGKAERRRPLIDSDWGFVKCTQALIADRDYAGGDEVDEDDDEDDE